MAGKQADRPGVVFTSIDDPDLPWIEGGGFRTARVFLGDPHDPATVQASVIEVRPGPADRARGLHRHSGDAINLVVRGSLCMDGQWFRAGEMKIVKANTEYGEAFAGPDGVVFLEIWPDVRASLPSYSDPDDQAFYEQSAPYVRLVEAGIIPSDRS